MNNVNNKDKYLCKRCNLEHGPMSCPAYGQECRICHKNNHFAVGCYKNGTNVIPTLRYFNFNEPIIIQAYAS